MSCAPSSPSWPTRSTRSPATSARSAPRLRRAGSRPCSWRPSLPSVCRWASLTRGPDRARSCRALGEGRRRSRNCRVSTPAVVPADSTPADDAFARADRARQDTPASRNTPRLPAGTARLRSLIRQPRRRPIYARACARTRRRGASRSRSHAVPTRMKQLTAAIGTTRSFSRSGENVDVDIEVFMEVKASAAEVVRYATGSRAIPTSSRTHSSIIRPRTRSSRNSSPTSRSSSRTRHPRASRSRSVSKCATACPWTRFGQRFEDVAGVNQVNDATDASVARRKSGRTPSFMQVKATAADRPCGNSGRDPRASYRFISQDARFKRLFANLAPGTRAEGPPDVVQRRAPHPATPRSL